MSLIFWVKCIETDVTEETEKITRKKSKKKKKKSEAGDDTENNYGQVCKIYEFKYSRFNFD